MQLSDVEERRISIFERMRGIESELFALSERLVEPDFEGGHLIEGLYAERTQLAIELLQTRRIAKRRALVRANRKLKAGWRITGCSLK